jgi:hypothetical protein
MGSNEEVYYYGKHPFLNRFKFPLLIIVGIMASLAWVIFSTSTSTLSPTASETDKTNIIAEPADNANPDAVLDPNAIAPEVAPVEEVQPIAPAPVPIEEPIFEEPVIPVEPVPANNSTGSTETEDVDTSSQNSSTTNNIVSYENCTAVWAARNGPIYPSDPGWQNKFDRDNDGTGCDERP